MSSSPSQFFLVQSRVGVVVCLENANAISLFRHLGRALRAVDRSLPDVASDPQIAFLPNYGQAPRDWPAHGLSPGLLRLHLFERKDEGHPLWQRLKDVPGIVPAAVTTTKARLFNYISPRAIQETLGVAVEVSDRNDVPRLTAQALHAKRAPATWDSLGPELQATQVQNAERLLSEEVGPAITPEMLVERRAKSDVTGWLYYIKLNLPWQFFG